VLGDGSCIGTPFAQVGVQEFGGPTQGQERFGGNRSAAPSPRAARTTKKPWGASRRHRAVIAHQAASQKQLLQLPSYGRQRPRASVQAVFSTRDPGPSPVLKLLPQDPHVSACPGRCGVVPVRPTG